MNKTANISAMIAAAAFGSINLFGCKSDDADTANEKELEMLKKAVEDYNKAAGEKKSDKCDAVRTKFDAEHKKWEDKYKDMFSKMSKDDKKAADEKWKSKIDEQKTKMNEARGKCYAAGGKKDPDAGSGGSPEKLTAAEKKEKAEKWLNAAKTDILEPYTKKLNELKADTAKSQAEREQEFQKIMKEYEEKLKSEEEKLKGIKKEDLEQLAGGTSKEPVASYNMALSKFQTAVDECREAVHGIDASTVQAFFQEKAIKLDAWTTAYAEAAEDEDATSPAEKKAKCDAVDCDYEPLQPGADQAAAQNPAWLSHFYALSEERQQELLGDIADVQEAEEAFKQARNFCYASAYFADEANKAKATTYTTASAAIEEEYTTKMSADSVKTAKEAGDIFIEGYTKLYNSASSDENKELVGHMKAIDGFNDQDSLMNLVGEEAYVAYTRKESALREVLKAKSEKALLDVLKAETEPGALLMFATEEELKALKECIAPDQQPEPEQSPKNNSPKKRSGSRRKSKSGNLSPDANGF